MNKKGLFIIFICILILLSAVQYAVESLIIGESRQRLSNTSNSAKYSLFIDIEDKTLFLMQDDKCIRMYPIASGMSGLPSPIGLWTIIEKGDWGEGFGGRWMGLNVPWGIYGIHGTSAEDTIGSAASHGCIRMFNSDIRELYDLVSLGTSVHIVNGPYGAFGRGFSDIEVGDRGADVMAIQERLRELGYFNGYSSGIYEDDLKHALHQFQKDRGLEVKNTITREDYYAMGFRDFE